MAAPALSIVIPAFNEARRIKPTLAALDDFCSAASEAIEVILVDDGSRDATGELLAQAGASRPTWQVIRLPHNRGKGGAVQAGVLASQGAACLICDADLSSPLSEYAKLRPWLLQGYDVVIGSRDLPESQLDPPQPLHRRLPAWAFRALRRRILLPEIRDTQCGFKLFRGAVARALFAELTVPGWLFDCEILALAQHGGQRIKEIGVTWRHAAGTRVFWPREVLRALRTLRAIHKRVAAMPESRPTVPARATGCEPPP